MSSRGSFASKFGVLMATVGSAVGLGNIWRFPYQMANNGGAAFLLIYVVCVFLVGVPAMMAEFVIGRQTHKNAVGAFNQLAPNKAWRGLGYLGVFTGFVIDSYYCVVTGWTVYYLYLAVSGSLLGNSVEGYDELFSTFAAGEVAPIVTIIIVVMITSGILVMGVRNGIEKVSKLLMPMLFMLLIILAINSCCMSGAVEGLKYVFVPNFSQIGFDSFVGAAGQAFFSLSIGMGALITYSSYFGNDVNLTRTATQIAVIDMLVAIIAGIIIFPAVFTFGVTPEQGPGLVLKVFPVVFTRMSAGYIWSVLFYLLLFIAALTSFLSITEVVVAYMAENFKLKRWVAASMVGVMFIILGACASLSFGPLKSYTIGGLIIFDMLDYLASNILLPIGGMLTSLFVGWRLDQKIVASQLKVESPSQYKFFKVYIIFLRFIVPLAVGIVFITQFFS